MSLSFLQEDGPLIFADLTLALWNSLRGVERLEIGRVVLGMRSERYFAF